MPRDVHPDAADLPQVRLTGIDELSQVIEDQMALRRSERPKAEQILDDHHYGLEKVKERILEFLAVRKLAPVHELIEKALSLAAKEDPDLILLDVMMPDMDGLEVIRLIKSQWPQVRIVVLAMYATRRAAALAAGTDAFLLKGCPAQDLLDAIANHVHPTGQA